MHLKSVFMLIPFLFFIPNESSFLSLILVPLLLEKIVEYIIT